MLAVILLLAERGAGGAVTPPDAGAVNVFNYCNFQKLILAATETAYTGNNTQAI
jgi:hypothetical protein